jgi:hypothetical protein
LTPTVVDVDEDVEDELLEELVLDEVVVTGMEQPRACRSGSRVDAAAGLVRYVCCSCAQPAGAVVVVLDDVEVEDDDEDELVEELEVELVGMEQPKLCSWLRRIVRASGWAT